MSQVIEMNDGCAPHNTETTGTLQYMAPESLAHSTYSSCSDIYSVGIIMWEF